MNYLDIIFCIPLLWGFWKGFQKGLIIEIATLAALLLAVWGGIKFSDYMAGVISSNFEVSEKYLPVVAFGVTFLLIVVAVYAIGKLVERFVDLVAMKMVNKVAGGAFGMAKFGVILSVLLVIVNSYDEKAGFISQELKDGSLLYAPMSEVALTVVPALQNSQLFEDVAAEASALNEEVSADSMPTDSIPTDSLSN
jgi:membrane protein required for colicin V production